MNSKDLSPNASQDKVTLNPNLQAALRSLNLNLEAELDRFEQEQKRQKGITVSQSNSSASSRLSEPTHFSSSDNSFWDIDVEQESSADAFVPEQNLQEPPESYLASSEELLRHLSEGGNNRTFPKTKHSNQNKDHQKASSDSSWQNYLLTPLGIAGVLIFFLSGTLLSMILVNFAQARFSNGSSGDPVSPSASSPSSQTEESTDATASNIPNRPNLAEDEFIELDVDRLVEAEPKTEDSVPENPSCGMDFYCVMVENPNQMEYQKTRQLVADAYLRDFPEVGQVLQAGAFKQRLSAEALQKRLEQQGITATIYEP